MLRDRFVTGSNRPEAAAQRLVERRALFARPLELKLDRWRISSRTVQPTTCPPP